MFRWRRLPQRLVRTAAVVIRTKKVERALLIRRRLLRRSSGLFVERPMKALVTTILLRLPGLDSLVSDTELNPPDAERRESADRRRRERSAVVRANGARQSELAERTLEVLADGLMTGHSEAVSVKVDVAFS